VIRRLWDEFAGSGRVAFAPAPGHWVVVAEDGDLAVVDGSGQPGWWVQVGSGLPGIDQYGSTVAGGYTSQRYGWHVEHDPTVHGEVVSPILPYQDGTAAQRQRALVLGVIRRYGGGNESRAGGHVHVGVGIISATLRRCSG